MSRFSAASTYLRLLFGYIQCITIMLRFQNVQWPPAFRQYLQVLAAETGVEGVDLELPDSPLMQ